MLLVAQSQVNRETRCLSLAQATPGGFVRAPENRLDSGMPSFYTAAFSCRDRERCWRVRATYRRWKEDPNAGKG